MTEVICSESRTDVVESTHSFDAKDAKGRSIGAAVRTFVATFVESKAMCGYMTVPGTVYGFWAMATRDGKTYGACQSARYFPTAEARDAALAKYLKDAAKRAAKTSQKEG